MTIGIDISQLAFENTGVSNYLKNLIENLIGRDVSNEYVLFYSSLRKNLNADKLDIKENPRVKIKRFRMPPTFLNILWNKLHILPIENFIGKVDIFITSDWTEPPTKQAKKATILYDLLVYKYPEEMHNKTEFNLFKLLVSPNIVSAQRSKLNWVKKESDKILCISKSTAEDAMEILGLSENKLEVIYPGL